MHHREPLAGGQRIVAWTGLIAALLGMLTVLLPMLLPVSVPPLAGFLALLVFACVVPGAAVVCHVRLGDAVAAWAIVLVLSMSVSSLVAVALVWTRWWEPEYGLLAVAAVSVLSCLRGLFTRVQRVSRKRPETIAAVHDETTLIPRITDDTEIIPMTRYAGGATATAVIPRQRADTAVITRTVAPPRPRQAQPMPGAVTPPPQRRRAPWDVLAGIVGLLAVAYAWIFSLTQTQLTEVDDNGLLSAVHPAFFVAVAGCVLAFVLELARRKPRAWALTGQTVLLVLIMHATVPILIRLPEYAWTYKHLGIIDLIASGRPLANPYDVYQQWPAFFALVAQMTSLSGFSAMPVASWAAVFFGLANLLLMYALARTLTSDRRVVFLTVFIFTAINWVAQDYLAPQAFAYTLSLGAVLVMLRWLRREPLPPRGGPRPLTRIWSWVQTGVEQVPYTSKRARTLALITLYVVYIAITVSHQLSPYMVAVSALMLVMFRLVQPIQIVPIFGVIALLQIVPHYRLVESLGLFDGFNLFANATPHTPTQGDVSDGRILYVQAVQALALAVWLTAILVVVANRRRLGPYAVPAALAAGPFAMLLAQSYGGEVIFRIFLFSSPWCAYLIASGILKLRLDRRLAVALATPVLTLATMVAIHGEHGQLMVNSFTPAEVRAAQYLYTNVPERGAVVMAGPNFPDRINARYTDVLGGVGSNDILLPNMWSEGAVPLGDAMNEADLDAINGYFAQYDEPAYLVVSKSQADSARYFGYFPEQRLDQVCTLLDSSPHWAVWYSNDDVQIYRYLRS